MIILFLGLITVLLPLLFILWLIYNPRVSKPEWFVKILLVGNIVLIFFQIGAWAFSSYYLKFFILGLFTVSVIYSYLTRRNLSCSKHKRYEPRLILMVLFVLCTLLLNFFVYSGRYYSGNAVALDFPLTQGNYIVLQGGSNSLTNPFHSVAPQAIFSIDIVKLNQFGNRAVSLFPNNLKQYNIYETELTSPCNGKILNAISNIPDNNPPKIDREQSSGNHIIIACNGIEVMLAHLKQNSLRITSGDQVLTGDILGEVGNSGYSNEPHLHLQANSPNGRSVPILFKGTFLSINDLYQQK